MFGLYVAERLGARCHSIGRWMMCLWTNWLCTIEHVISSDCAKVNKRIRYGAVMKRPLGKVGTRIKKPRQRLLRQPEGLFKKVAVLLPFSNPIYPIYKIKLIMSQFLFLIRLILSSLVHIFIILCHLMIINLKTEFFRLYSEATRWRANIPDF